MNFVLKPILLEIEAFYKREISIDRFRAYLEKLQGNSKDDLVLPIMGFNPMAKDHILKKVKELRALKAEKIMQDVIENFNEKVKALHFETVSVVVNVADDLNGAWTNYYTTDFASKFEIKALVNRNFCCPYFWASEPYSENLIKDRTLAYLSRTVFNITNEKPKTATEYLSQEIMVSEALDAYIGPELEEHFSAIKNLFAMYGHSDDYTILFNLFYGDEASKSLAYKTFGVSGKTGFDYARWLASKKNNV